MNWGLFGFPSRSRAPVFQAQLDDMQQSGYAYYDALVANYFRA